MAVQWTGHHQQAVDKMRRMRPTDTLAMYSNDNDNKWFDVNIDALDYRLGSFKLQEGCPICPF